MSSSSSSAVLTAASTSLLRTATSSSAAATSTANRAPPQGGVLEGSNPSRYNPKDPITIFIIQASLIIIVCHLLHWPLAKIRQPRVIAEIMGGIVLGPSVMGHIPGFRAAIFPTESLPTLTLVANLGLVLYLFLIGLETDVRFLISNWRVATSVAFAGMAFPFALGCALAWGLYNQFSSDEGIVHIKFGVFMLFIGVAIAITAFPVLCRILTELKLLDTSAGVIVLSAGVANDVVGWILLALCVALVNAGSGLTALWILLACVGYMLFLLYAVKPVLIWILRRSGSLENGPSQSIIALILLLALASAFFTGIIGVHAIFGGFMVGLILPRENGFTIKVTEKLEDLIGALFLPLYFTLSGLNTNLGLLNSGITWGYVFAVTLVAFFAKFIAASLAARFNKLVWRESFTIGVLMSCKGLVELIVLNIGLQAKILSTRTFTIFVVMALITTFATTPLTSFLYPPWYQQKLEAWKRGEIDWDSGAPVGPSNNKPEDGAALAKQTSERVNRLLVYLRLENMPTLLKLVLLFERPSTPDSSSQSEASGKLTDKAPSESMDEVPRRPVRAHGVRLIELTDRDSSVMTVAQVTEYGRMDPVVNTFRTVGQLHNIAVSGEVAVMPDTRFAEAIISKSTNMSSDLLVIPWSETGGMGDSQVVISTNVRAKLASPYMGFVNSVLESREHNLAIFFPNTSDGGATKEKNTERAKLMRAYSFTHMHHDFPTVPLKSKLHHIFLPYFGGEDDKFALSLVLQLSENPNVISTIVYIPPAGEVTTDAHFESVSTHVPTNIASRVSFETASSSNTVEEILEIIAKAVKSGSREDTRQNLVLLGRHGGNKLDEGKAAKEVTDEVKESLGVVAGHYITRELAADVMIVQAKASTANP